MDFIVRILLLLSMVFMRKYLVLVFLSCLVNLNGLQGQGIQFFGGNWSETLSKAKTEGKLVFIDFYTQWCGPCYNMAKDVFVRSDVGEFYNARFVNVKIDAENGEGIELAKRYGVRSYPTYAFVDPTTEELVHRSGSRQSADVFIYTGKSAVTPGLRSFHLEEEYQKGNRQKSFLTDYITYKKSVYANKDVVKAFDELLARASLADKDVWDLYVASISGVNAYTKVVSDRYEEFCHAFGKKAVDEKLKNDTQYGDLDLIESLCDYEGKSFNCTMIRVTRFLNEEKYEEASALIDSLMADPKTNQQDLIDRLKFIARVSYRGETLPSGWFLKCIGYLQYVAYNQKDRDDAGIHQEYAAALEILARRMAKGECTAPHCILHKPLHGKTVYNMRPDDLKQKPGVKSKKVKK